MNVRICMNVRTYTYIKPPTVSFVLSAVLLTFLISLCTMFCTNNGRYTEREVVCKSCAVLSITNHRTLYGYPDTCPFLCPLCVYYMYTGPGNSIVFQSMRLTLWTGTSTSVMGSFGEHVATILCTYVCVYSMCTTMIGGGRHSVIADLPNI